MDIVDKVAADITEIPGNPSAREIARIAIEAYQRELWTPAFNIENRRGMMPEFRRLRASQLTAHIMSIVSKYLCRHGDADGARDASRDLFLTIYESGAEIITDLDRSTAGLSPRNQYGITAEELRIREAKYIQAMLGTVPPMIVPENASRTNP